jgi:hypothetical protein
MKIAILIFTLFPMCNLAQKSAGNYLRVRYIEELNQTRMAYMNERYASEEFRKELGIKQIILESTHKSNSRKNKTSYIDFNTFGKKTREEIRKSIHNFTYENDTILVGIERVRKNKTTYIGYTYQDGKLVKRTLDKKGKRKEELTITYTPNNKVATSELMKGRKLNKAYTINNAYSSDGKLVKTTY